MKLIKSNNKTYLRISFADWKMIGRAFEHKEKLRLANSAKLVKTAVNETFISWDTFKERMESVGWVFSKVLTGRGHSTKIDYSKHDRAGNHIHYGLNPAVKPNTGIEEEWKNDNIWRNIKKDFRNRLGLSEFVDILYSKDFKFPPNFDMLTLKPKPKEAVPEPNYGFLKVSPAQLSYLMQEPNVKYQYEVEEMEKNNAKKKVWKNIEVVDMDAQSIMLEDSKIYSTPLANKIPVRKVEKA